MPFLTCKHPIDYCLGYADRAVQEGFEALVVLGGDKSRGTAALRRARLAAAGRDPRHQPDLPLGGWANPHASPAGQVGHLLEPRATAEFYLTQIVSHHSVDRVEAFLAEADAQAADAPWHVRRLLLPLGERQDARGAQGFLPVPAEELTAEFAAGATPDEICARTIRALREAGVRHFYVSNLPLQRASLTLSRVLTLAAD